MFFSPRSQPKRFAAILQRSVVLGAAAFWLGLCAQGFSAETKTPPNIVFILADDKYRNTTTE